MGLKDFLKPKWKHSDWRIWKDILAKITDEVMLTLIAKNGKRIGVRVAAVNKLTGKTHLTDVARNADDEQVRLAAVKLLHEEP